MVTPIATERTTPSSCKSMNIEMTNTMVILVLVPCRHKQCNLVKPDNGTPCDNWTSTDNTGIIKQ